MVFIGGAVLADVMEDKEEFWMTKVFGKQESDFIVRLLRSLLLLLLREDLSNNHWSLFPP